MIRMVLVSVAVALFGCAKPLPPTIKYYAPFVVKSERPRAETLAAVVKAAEALQPTRLLVDELDYHVRIYLSGENGVRERIDVAVKDKEMEIRAQTQVERAPGEWLTPRVVCAPYAYERERAFGDAIFGSASVEN